MYKSRHLIVPCLLVLFFGSCHLVAGKVSHDILDSFKKINNSITAENQRITASTDAILAADSAVTRAIDLMETIKQNLSKLDPGGENKHVAERLLVDQPLADTLQKALRDVQAHCLSLADTSQRPRLDSALHNIHRALTQPGWPSAWFKDEPTVAALTILSAWQSDCRHAGLLILTQHPGPATP